jgi:hypothetical protein
VHSSTFAVAGRPRELPGKISLLCKYVEIDSYSMLNIADGITAAQAPLLDAELRSPRLRLRGSHVRGHRIYLHHALRKLQLALHRRGIIWTAFHAGVVGLSDAGPIYSSRPAVGTNVPLSCEYVLRSQTNVLADEAVAGRSLAFDPSDASGHDTCRCSLRRLEESHRR